MTESLTLSHLRMLEAESIHILREVVAEFQRPVMLYSIGKDSSVMVRLAQKAQALINPARFLDVDASLYSSPEEAATKISVMLAERQIVPLER